MGSKNIRHTFRRYRTLQTDYISELPIVILMPHSACNCRCVMCDIWKNNNHPHQLNEKDIANLLSALQEFNVQEVLMSGGEALMNPQFFAFCRMLKKHGIKITLLSTGLLLQKFAVNLLEQVDQIIVSLDGDQDTHDRIRRIPGAFQQMASGIQRIRQMNPIYRISGRTVIHRLNFRQWPQIVSAAADLGLDQISFLPADVSSHAFNRELLLDGARQAELLVAESELAELAQIIGLLIENNRSHFLSGFIAESPAKLKKIHLYYAAFYGLNDFPYKKCNAPWVSTVIEADGKVRPCFFHPPIGDIHQKDLASILNSPHALGFRKSLDVATNPTCVKCVCSINLRPGANP